MNLTLMEAPKKWMRQAETRTTLHGWVGKVLAITGLSAPIALVIFASLVAWAPGAAAQQAVETARRSSTTVLAISTAGAGSHGQMTLSARVTGNGGSAPTGAVSFRDGDSELGSAFVDADGRATLTIDSPRGTASGPAHQVEAVYQGDSVFTSSASTPETAPAVSTGLPDFTLTVSPSSFNTPAGIFVTATVTATPINNFTSPLSLSCSGLPLQSSCAFSPQVLSPTPSGAPVSSQLTIETLAPSGAALRPLLPDSGSQTAYAIVLPGIAALAGLGLLRRRSTARLLRNGSRILGAALLLAGLSLGLGGCNPRYDYFHHAAPGNPGTPLGSKTITVSAAGTVNNALVSHSVQVALTVTQ